MDGSDEAGCASTLNEGIKMKVRVGLVASINLVFVTNVAALTLIKCSRH